MSNVFWSLLFVFLFSSSHCSYDDLGPKTSSDNEYCHDESCHQDEKTDIKQRGDTSIAGIINHFGNAVKYMGEAAFKTIYKLSEDVLEDIANIVRNVFSEEAYNIVSNAGKSALNILFDTGLCTCTCIIVTHINFIDMVFSSVGATILSVSIFVTMILINYLLINYFSILSILTLDATVFLMHGLIGPVQMALWFLSGCSVVYQCLTLTISHPYLSSTLLVILFLFSCCGWPILRRKSKYLRRADDTVYMIEDKLSQLEAKIEELARANQERDDKIIAQLTRIESILLSNNDNLLLREP